MCNYDSSDVWANPEIFKLNKEKKPVFVSGSSAGLLQLYRSVVGTSGL